MKTLLLATMAGGLFAMPAMNYFGAPQVVFDKPDDMPASVAALATEIKGEFNKSLDKVKEIAETALADAKKSGEISTAIKGQADEALIKMNGLNEQLSQLEQRVAEGTGGGAERAKSFGEQFAEDE